MAYITACTTVQAVIREIFEIFHEILQDIKIHEILHHYIASSHVDRGRTSFKIIPVLCSASLHIARSKELEAASTVQATWLLAKDGMRKICANLI